MTGIEMTHVPYRGSAPALTEVIAGHVPLLFSDTVPSLPQIRKESACARRVHRGPLPIAAGDPSAWRSRRFRLRIAARLGSVLGAGGLAEDVVSKLQAALTSVNWHQPDVQQQIIRLGMIPAEPSSPEELQRFISAEIVRWEQGRAAGGQRPGRSSGAAEQHCRSPAG